MTIAQTFLMWLSLSANDPAELTSVMYVYTNSPYVQQTLSAEQGWGWKEEVHWTLLLTEVLTILCSERHRIDEVPGYVAEMEVLLGRGI